MIFESPLLYIVIAIVIAGYLIWHWRVQGKDFKGFGGSSMLALYTRDLTEEARQGTLDPVVGRQEEIERVVHILARKRKNNPILLGEAGVGKTAVVEGLAHRIVKGDAPDSLKNKRLLVMDLSGLISGTKYRGEFEQRIKRFLDEILSAKRKIILFIDEVHMIVQAKGSEGALNVSDILKPALARGDLQAIGATTRDDYEKYIRPDDALDRRFQPVLVDEPKPKDALEILKGIKHIYEEYHKVKFLDETLETAVALSAKYIKARYLPDKAIDLIDEAGAKLGIEEAHETRHAAGLLHAAACKHKDRMHEHEGKTPLVTGKDIREIVAEWTGKPVKEVI